MECVGPDAAYGERKPSHSRLRKAHCDAALNYMGSVNHAGKLFERIEISRLAARDEFYGSL